MVGEYEITPEARDWGRAWYEKHHSERPAHLDNDRFGGYLARKQTHIHKLAIIVAAAQSSYLQITREHLVFADGLVTALEQELPRVFSTIGQNEVTRGLSELVGIVLRRRRVTQTALYRELFRTMTAKQFYDALNSAVSAGYLSISQEGNEKWIIALEKLPVASD